MSQSSNSHSQPPTSSPILRNLFGNTFRNTNPHRSCYELKFYSALLTSTKLIFFVLRSPVPNSSSGIFSPHASDLLTFPPAIPVTPPTNQFPIPTPPPAPEPPEEFSDPFLQTFSRFATTVEKLGSDKSLIKEPEIFDGNNPHKLRSFLVTIQLNINSHPDAFPSDAKKIAFILFLSLWSGTRLVLNRKF
ncbi:hypothetical protein K435DRAFT_856384 [Dendrothele bispora CBS 962.96]|uniref:Uncharacterized protein n=1 Tax=Dendrothele bispora (strain CBS 962.96) TaxID=1314807 RepID=A0A4V4HGG3_DENBC|nr:hypothetical protein K435DRAFT_856384 [Dendrothele bispora CBS 962.96]